MADQVIDATVFDDPNTPADESELDVNGLIITHPSGGVVSGTGGYTPFLRQNNSDGTTTGFNTSDTNTLNNSGTEGLDMEKAWTTSLKVSDLPIVYIDGVAYYEIRLDLNEENSGTDSGGDPKIELELSEFQVYTSTQQATLADYTAGSGTVLDSDFNLVYDLDSGGVDRSIILIDGPSGSGNDDYAFYIPVSAVGTDPDLFFTLFAQFGPQPQEGATFEEFRIQNTAQADGVKFNDEDNDGIRDAGEDGLEGFVMYIDANGNNLLDVGEVTATSDADGNFTFYGLVAGTYVVREVLTEDDLSAGIKADPDYDSSDYLPPSGYWTLTTGTGGDHSFSIVKSGSTLGDVTLEVGNHELNPSIDISKSATVDGGCADLVGEKVNYAIDVTNDGDTDLTNVVVTDSFADVGSIAAVDDDSDGFNDGDTDEDGVLDPGETWSYTAYHTVTQADIDANGNYDSDADQVNDVLRNVATVNADSDQTDSTVTDNDDATVDVCQDPALGIDKTATVDGDCADVVGEKVEYTILVSNEGNVGLENVVVTDDFADVGSLDNDGDDDGVIDGDTDDDGILDVGETWTYTAFHTVTQADIDANGNYDSDADGIDDVLRNVATANADAVTTGEAAQQVTDDATVDVCQDPSVVIDKTATVDGDCADVVGEKVEYTIIVTNDGNVTLENVVLTDTLADVGSIDNDADDDGVIDGDTDDDGLLDVGETWTYTAFHTVTQADIDANGNYDSDADGVNDQLRNVATVDADAVTTGESVTDDDDAVVEVCQDPALGIDKTATVDGDCADVVGEKVEYTILVSNEGNVGLENVVVTDDFADVGSLDNDGDDDGVIDGDTDDDGILDVGETWTYTAFHTVTQADIDANGNYDSDADGILDVLRNQATANADAVTTGEAAQEVSDDAEVDVCQDPALSIDKTATVDGDCADVVGEKVEYTILVGNAGNVGLENLVVSDDFADVGSLDNDADDDGVIDGDTDDDGILDVGETWTYTAFHTVTQEDIDANGNYDSDADGILDVLRNLATANADAVTTGEAAQEVTDDATVDVCQDPSVVIDKTATVDGDCADTVGELINYSISVTNDGNVTLENVVVTDDFADVGSVEEVDEDSDGFNDGDTDADGLLDVGETWLYTAFHTVTQADIDSGGNYDSDADQVNDVLRNVATVNADAVTTGESVTDDDDAAVEVCQDITVDLTKYVDVGFGWDDANTGPGPNNVNVGDDVSFKLTIENTGNVTLTEVDVIDTYLSNGAPGTPNLLIDDGVLTQYAIDHGATLTGDDDNDGDLDVGETWEIIYTEAFDPSSFAPGAHLNTADVTTAEGAEDEDSAYYFSLINDGPGVRTPGFWQNPNNGAQFWDGIVGNEKHAGEDCMPAGELARIDWDGDGDIDDDDGEHFIMQDGQKGLLLGDWNLNGVEDAGEDTLFVSLAAANLLINASLKEQQDGRFMLGRDVVASWLNYLAGNNIGEIADDGDDSPKEAIQGAIDFLQTYGDTGDNGIFTTLNKKSIVWEGTAIKTSSTAWQNTGADIHGDLDEYNNTGWIDGEQYAHDCDDQAFVSALSVYQDHHSLI